VVAIDDCQWMDKTSAELLGYLVERSFKSPILFYLNRRSGPGTETRFLEQTLHSINPPDDRILRISLGGLSRRAGRDLINKTIGSAHLPPRVESTFLERAEGNPLFLLELARSFLNREIKLPAAGGPVNWEDLSLSKVPTTLSGLLGWRIDKLDKQAREILGIAAVIGREFDFELVAEVSGDPGACRKNLKEIVSTGLVSPVPGNDGGTFIFQHHLMRDIVYNHVLKSRRADYHRRIAGALVKVYRHKLDDLNQSVAYHFEQGQDYKQALLFYLKAARRAREKNAPREAIRFLEKALEMKTKLKLGSPSKLETSLLQQKASLYKLVGNYKRALLDYLGIVERGPRTAGFSVYCRALTEMGEIYRLRGETDRSLLVLRKAVSLAKKAGLPRTFAECLNRLGVLLASMGNLEGAETNFMESLVIRKKLNDTKGIADCYTNLGGIALHRDQFDLAIEYNKQSQAIYRRLGDSSYLARSLNNIGVALEKKGDYAAAREYYWRSLDVRKLAGDRFGVAMSLSNIGDVEMNLGHPREAIRKHNAALFIFRSLGQRSGEAHSLNGLGKAYMSLGDYRKSEEMFEKAMECAAPQLDLPLKIEISLNRVISAANNNDLATARKIAEDALKIARRAGDTGSETRFLEILRNGLPGHGQDKTAFPRPPTLSRATGPPA